jgi:hypothetical protein
MATGGTATHALLGAWRIVETELWDLDDLDGIEPAPLTLAPKGRGGPGLLAIEFSFEGFDEGDRLSGRGWAILDDEQLRGHLFVHHGDDSGFTARRDVRAAAPRHRRGRA